MSGIALDEKTIEMLKQYYQEGKLFHPYLLFGEETDFDYYYDIVHYFNREYIRNNITFDLGDGENIEEVSNDKNRILEAIEKWGVAAFLSASDEKRNDIDFIKELAVMNSDILKYIGDEAKNQISSDYDTLLELAKIWPSILDCVDPESDAYQKIIHDKDTLVSLVKKDFDGYYVLKHACDELKGDYGLVEMCVYSDPRALEFAGNGLNDDAHIFNMACFPKYTDPYSEELKSHHVSIEYGSRSCI